jgi:uncharacterized protein (TIRG00374 family)
VRPPALPAGRVLLRRLVRPALVAAGLAVIAYLVHRVGPEAIWSSFQTLSWWLLPLICFPSSAAVLLHTLGWRFAFARPPRSFPRLFGARVAGEAVNVSTPTASVGGEPVKAYLLRPGVPLQEGLVSVVLDKTTVVVGQTVLLLAGVATGWFLRQVPRDLLATMAALLVVEIVVVGGFVAVQLRGLAGRSGRLLSRFGIGPGHERQSKLDDLDRSVRLTYQRHRGRLALSVLCHFLAFALDALEIFLVVRLLGVPVSLPVAFTVAAFGNGVKFISFMIPAGLGALEGGNVAFFAALGLGGAIGLSYTLVRRLREILWVAAGFVALHVLSARPLPPAARDSSSA